MKPMLKSLFLFIGCRWTHVETAHEIMKM